MSKKIFTLIAVVASLNALAQKDTSISKNLDEVVVTATKFPIKTSATGKVISVITKEQLEQSGGKDLSQILSEQSGLFINGSNSNAGKEKSVFMRGASSKYTLIIIDGVPVYDPSGPDGNFDIRNLSVNLIERIEILKGSQSTLYGSDAVAGVINIITKKLDTNKKIATNGLLSYGSNNSTNANAGIAGKVNKVDYSFGYTYNKTDGISEATSSNANADKDEYKQESFQANLGFAVAKNVSIKPYMRYTYLRGSTDYAAFTDDLNYKFSTKNFSTGVKNEFAFGKTKLNILYNFNKVERNLNDSTIYVGAYKGNEHFVDAYANFNLCKSTKLTVGVDYRNSNFNQYEFYDYGFGFTTTSKLNKDTTKQNQLGVYAALNINNSKGFNIELGGRLNKHSAYGSNAVFNINPSYQVTDDIKIFANISSSYRTPSLYQLYSEYGNRELKPELGLSTEIGLQHYFDNKNIKTQLVVFSRTIKDVQTFVSIPTPPYGTYTNRDKQKDLGFEFETEIKASKNTTIKAFYSYVDGTIDTKKSNGKDTTFHNLLRRPKNSLGFNVATKITNKLFANVNVQWFGEREDAYFDNTTFKTVNVTNDNYALVDIYAEYAIINKVKIFANARNITNTKYVEVIGYNTLGTTITGGVRFNF